MRVSFLFGGIMCTFWPRFYLIIIEISVLPFRQTHETWKKQNLLDWIIHRLDSDVAGQLMLEASFPGHSFVP